MNTSENPVNMQAIVRETLLRFGFLIETPPAAQSEAAKLAEPDFMFRCTRYLSVH